MAYSLNPSSDNCYEGTTCLVNKIGIRDEKKLAMPRGDAHLGIASLFLNLSYPFFAKKHCFCAKVSKKEKMHT